MSYIPKNAAKLLKNKKLMREYALKPYGYDVLELPKSDPQKCQFPQSSSSL